MSDFDLVIYNGQVVTASDILPSSVFIGIRDGKIEAITIRKIQGKKEINADGGYIMPGGIDSHVHIDQDNAPVGDDFDSGSKSAICGGTTCIIPFAIQPKNDFNLIKVVEDYHKRAMKKGGVYCDYGFHLIISEPSEELIQVQLPKVSEVEAITSVKVYTTYPRYRLSDEQLLQVLLTNRKLNITTMIHAENSDIIDFINKKLKEKQLTDPFYHSISRPMVAEEEASNRVIALANMIGVPILIVHMSSEKALGYVKKAQNDLLPIFAETCPQYLFLTSDFLKHDCCHHLHHEDHFEGAKYICSPPLRQTNEDLEGVWKHLINGTVSIFSSDHAPSKYDHPKGKMAGFIDGIPHYTKVPNGLPGIETRLPLLFCYGVETGRITPQKFVELTSTNPAKMYGLNEIKGTIGVGMDADLTIWYPDGAMQPFELKNVMLHHSIDYTPYEGMKFTNWPKYTILRGQIVYDRDNGGVTGGKIGRYLRRKSSALVPKLRPLDPIYT